jgi:GntR family transcriptional regulator / MocR family aminotransferase
VSRSVRADASDVHVTQGAQQALHLIGRVMIAPGDCVAVEEPGYPPARALFASLGARVVGVPVDEEGIDVSALPADARLVYVTPSHQYPLGVPMSLVRRMALLSWARRHDSVIVEDDYDSEFRFADRPLDPLQSLDRDGRVIYVGSFAKTLLPMLRLGFLIAPPPLHQALRSARQLTDWHGDVVGQGALAELIDEGLLARHIRRATRVYAERHAVLVETLRRDFAGWLTVLPSVAGLHVCARLAPGGPAPLDSVLAAARALGVSAPTLAARCAGPPQQGLVLGYGLIGADRIPEGLRRLATAFGSA